MDRLVSILNDSEGRDKATKLASGVLKFLACSLLLDTKVGHNMNSVSSLFSNGRKVGRLLRCLREAGPGYAAFMRVYNRCRHGIAPEKSDVLAFLSSMFGSLSDATDDIVVVSKVIKYKGHKRIARIGSWILLASLIVDMYITLLTILKIRKNRKTTKSIQNSEQEEKTANFAFFKFFCDFVKCTNDIRSWYGSDTFDALLSTISASASLRNMTIKLK